MTSREDLGLLDRFNADGGIALSIYLDVSTAERHMGALDRVREHVRAQGETDGAAMLLALAEDLDMVELYLGTTAAHSLSYVAIFSCASQLFWRAYPLHALSEESITIGDRFETGPLHSSVRARKVVAAVPLLEPDLLPHG